MTHQFEYSNQSQPLHLWPFQQQYLCPGQSKAKIMRKFSNKQHQTVSVRSSWIVNFHRKAIPKWQTENTPKNKTHNLTFSPCPNFGYSFSLEE